MARKHRPCIPDAMYHVTSRGNRKETLFYDSHDFFKYLSLLKETKESYPFKILSYCLMTNHVHLQIQTQEHQISQIIRVLHSRYARSFNNKYNLVGHVFQGRFHSELISLPDYELEVNRYIHLNPLRANIVKNLDDYPWSSHHAYTKNKPDPLIDDTSYFLSLFPHPQQENYKKFLLSESKPHEIILNNFRNNSVKQSLDSEVFSNDGIVNKQL